MMWLLELSEALLVAPYRWPADAMTGFWLGTITLTLICVFLGEVSRALATGFTGKAARAAQGDVARWQGVSLSALRQGDRGAYAGANRLAVDAFSRDLGLRLASGLAPLWPAVLAVGWVQARFAGVVIAQAPWFGDVGAVTVFLLCFVLAQLGRSLVRQRWSNSTASLSRGPVRHFQQGFDPPSQGDHRGWFTAYRGLTSRLLGVQSTTPPGSLRSPSSPEKGRIS